MLDPVVQSALVALLAAGLNWVCVHFGIPISPEVLTAVAVGIIAWILGLAGGYHVSSFLRRSFKAK